MSILHNKIEFVARIKERFLLTKPTSTKKTYHLSLDLSGSNLSFRVGDSLGVFPQNDPVLVERLLTALKCTGKEKIIDPRGQGELSFQEFLSSKVNLSRTTSSLLKQIYEREQNHDKKLQLRHLLESKPLLSEYLAYHEPLDVIKEYPDVSFLPQEISSHFAPLLPRFYSVASSLKVIPEEVHLTVALSSYIHGKEERFGVASHFLCHLAEPMSTPVPLYVQSGGDFTLPSDPARCLIMVGPGTGVAPFRAFLQERCANHATGKHWLFFGECHQKTDFLYEEFLQGLVSQGLLRLDVAFSRDQSEKVYVQHKMYEHKKDLWKWLEEGAYFYVCGDAKSMAKDVEAMVKRIIQEEGNLSEEGAKEYVKALKKEKRYLADVY